MAIGRARRCSASRAWWNPEASTSPRRNRSEIPGLCVFMGIPGVRPALDQWEAMLPVAERLAGLLGGRLLDERRNALGRQAIAHMRDELRAFDRRQGRRRIGPEQGRSR
ncbi:MAG: cell division protein ZipA C-terminal FtsZ-binding domain-containing protein [Xanthomonadales bacterium]|nr:cell division protein ZipA C-terminal FtsZ-binding domain-containing protein [Xanthomonadales bacterium]